MKTGTYYAVHRGNTNDEIMHWKYIKKIKKNGKWRYYYDKDQFDKDIGLTAKRDADNFHNKIVAETALTSAKFNELGSYNRQSEQQKAHDDYNKMVDKVFKDQNKYYNVYMKRYYKTPLGKISKAVNSGKKLLERITGKRIGRRDFEAYK